MDSTRLNPAAQTELAATLAGDLRALIGTLRRRLREQATPGDFTPSQMAVLLRLEREDTATVSNLAKAEGMRPQSMGTVLAALDAGGFVNSAPDPGDGRQTLWSLSASCRQWLAASRAARQDWLSRTIQARLSADEQQQLATAVELLKRIVA